MDATRLALSRPARRALCLTGFGLALAVSLALGCEEVLAQTSTTTMDIPPGFRPVPGGQPAAEQVNASLLVIIAYGVFAFGFAAYLFFMARHQAKLASEIAALGARIEAQERSE